VSWSFVALVPVPERNRSLKREKEAVRGLPVCNQASINGHDLKMLFNLLRIYFD
jgi:hypothetical protein